MSDSIVINRYAVALFDAVRQQDAVEPVRQGLDDVVAALAFAAPRRLFANPRISAADKQAVLTDLAARLSLAEPLQRLLVLLTENGRIALVGPIATRFGELADEARGRKRVTVTSAVALPKTSKTVIDERLISAVGADTHIRHEVDPTLLGGLIVQIGSRVFDNSVRHHLSQLRQALL